MARSSCYMVVDEIKIVLLAWYLVGLTSILLMSVSWMYISFISPPCLIYSVYISISLCKPSSLVYRWVPSISCIIISKLGHRGHTPVWCPWRVGSHAEVIIWTWGKGLIVQRVLIHHYRRSSVLRLPGIFFWPLASSDHTTDDQDGQNHEDGSSCDWSNDHSLILFLRLFTGV